MKKFLLLSFMLMFAFTFSESWAQERTVSGKVSSLDGETLPGVNVVLKGTTSGTVTDIDGNYKLSVPSDGGTLVFSFIGLATEEIAVGARSVIDLQMSPDVKQLSEVVVTALGLETQRDRLGTASSPVAGQAIAKSGEATLINGLSAKASGVNVVRSSGDPGAGSYIQIRGQSTITGNTQPLVIVDGVPIYNSTIGNNTGNDGGVVQQSRMNDINPNDIASVEVLKGASAAALWGTRAANGVIMITTKSGKSAKGKINVSINSTVSVDKLYIAHELQNNYGGGLNGRFYNTPPGGLSWGDYIPDRAGGADAEITDPLAPGYAGYFEAESGNRYYNIANGTAADPHGGKNSKETYDYKDKLFKNGYFLDNNISVSGGDSDANFYLSIGNLKQEGIIKNNSDYERTSFRFKSEKRFSDLLKLGSNFSYTRTTSNRVQMGSNLSGLFLGGLRTRADFNSSDYLGTYYAPNGEIFPGRQRAYRNPLGASTGSVYDNPLWMMNNVKDISEVDRFIGSFQADIKATDWLTITARAGVDHYNDKRDAFFPSLSAGANSGGRYTNTVIKETQFNADVFGRSSFELNSDLDLDVLLGMNFNHRRYDATAGEAFNFIISQNAPFDVNNASSDNISAANNFSEIRTAAMYLTSTLGYKDQLYLTVTGRGESASAFGRDANATFIYPSADVAWQFTEAIGSNNVLSFGKLRAAYGTVGVQPGPYNTVTYFEAGGYGESWGPELNANAALYGGGYTESATLGNSELSPEKKTEIELGTDLKFFDNKVNLSATYFTNETTDAILPVATAPATGFTSKLGNAGTIENTGIELDLGAQILKAGDFSWRVDGNWSRIRNEVTSLAGTTSIFLSGFTGTSSRAVEGQPLGVLWGTPFERDDAGALVLNTDGFPQADTEEGVLGNPNPDFKAGLSTTFEYKRVKLYILGEFTKGGDIWAGTYGVLKYFGRAADTDVRTTLSAADAATIVNYNGNTIDALVPANADGTYTFRGELKDFGAGPVALEQQWYRSLGGGFGPVAEENIFDATNYRIREVSLSYSFPAFKTGSVSLTASGRNLLIVGPDVDKIGNDPETNLTGTSNGRGLDYFNNPSTRSYFFTVGLTF